jgi:hypothetical protein
MEPDRAEVDGNVLVISHDFSLRLQPAADVASAA